MKVTEAEYRIIKKASDINSVKYEISWTDAENLEGYIDPEELFSMVEDLVYAYEDKKEELRDLEQDLEDNYKPISRAEEIGWSHDW